MAKELHLTIYDCIDSWCGVSAKGIQEKLQANTEAEEIILHINSPGGSVYEGYTIYNLLKGSGKKITAKIEGMCASIATLIALSADEIEMLPMAQWLIHNPFTQIEGDAADLLKAVDELKRIEETLVSVYVAKTGKTDQEIKALMNEDKFISAQDAVEMGFATRIAEPLKAVAYFSLPKTNPNNNVMNEEQQNSLADKIINGLKGLFQPKAETQEPTPQAATTTLENGETIYHEGELAEGAAVFSDAEMTMALADGEYVLSDSRIMTVAGGMVTTIAEAEPANAVNEELVQANAEIERLKGELAAVTNAKDTTIKNLRAEVAQAKKRTPAQDHSADPIKPAAKSGNGPKLPENSIAAAAAKLAR